MFQRKLFYLIFIFIGLWVLSFAQLASSDHVQVQSNANGSPVVAESVSTQTSIKKKVETPSIPNGKNRKKQTDNVDNVDSSINLEQLQEKIDGIDLLLTTPITEETKFNLALKESYLHITMARAIGLKRKSVKEMTSLERRHLQIAKKHLETIEESPVINNSRKATIHYLLGIIASEYDQFDLRIHEFELSVGLDPKSPQASGLALTIAEWLFDKENYREAIVWYLDKVTGMSLTQLTLAYYKAGWCYTNLQLYDKAEEMFLRIIDNPKSDPSFVQDSLRDMAFASIQQRSEQDVIEFGRSKLKKDKFYSQYLILALKFLFSKEPKIERPVLSAEILKEEKKPAQRLQALGLFVNMTRRENYNPRSTAALDRLTKEMTALKIKPTDAAFLGIATELEADSLSFIRILSETYAGKLKSLEGLLHAQLGEILEYHLKVHSFLFSENTQKATLFAVWMDYCIDIKSVQCIESLIKKIKNSKKKTVELSQLNVKLRQNHLVFLEANFKTPEGEKKFIEALIAFHNDFPDDPNTHAMTKRLGQYYFERKKFENALIYFEEVFNKERSEENLYKYWYVLFQLGNCKKILESTELKIASSSKFSELKRECHLKTAISEITNNDFAAYEKNIKDFISLKPDKVKLLTAYQDYLNRSFEIQGLNGFIAVWDSIDKELRTDKAFEPVRLKVAATLIEQEKLQEIAKVTFATDVGDLGYLYIAQRLGFDEKPESFQNRPFLGLSSQHRSHLLSLMALSRPELAILYYSRLEKLTDSDRQFLLLAYRIQQKTENVDLTNEQIAMLGAVAPEKLKNRAQTRLEKEIAEVKIPSIKVKPARYNREVAYLVDKTRAVRRKVLESLKDSSLEKQRTLTERAAQLEKSTAEAIQRSPIPEGLSKQQKDEYSSGIAKIAQEYFDQNQEFAKLNQLMAKRIEEIELKRSSENLSMLEIEKWRLPNTNAVNNILALFKRSPFAALFVLDNVRTKEKINEVDYYRIRGGLLIRMQNSVFMRNFVRDEWLAHQRKDLVEEWRKLAKSEPSEPNA
jgi:tetratricopeptide (TPR) repeat protein